MGKIYNAQIVDTHLGSDDHGGLTFWLYLQYDCYGCGFGGYPLNTGGIMNILKTLDVDCWEQLRGKHIRCEKENYQIKRIGHLMNDQWFDAEEYYKNTTIKPEGETCTYSTAESEKTNT